jgi:hypothetical protein
MPPSDFRGSEDFPDFSLPERTDKPWEYIHREPRPSRPAWRQGDRVLAPWEPNFLYAGRVVEIRDNQALIEFDDGDAGWVLLELLRPLAVPTGQKVLCRRRMGASFFAAEIRQLRGDEVCVVFDEGPDEMWTSVAALRIPCQPAGPGAAPTRIASHLAFLKHLQPGDRVWAPWNIGSLFAGTVDRIEDTEVHVHFDDGDRGWVQLEQLAPLDIPIGLRVLGRWRMGAQFFPGIVTELKGDKIHIQYDDGDREWTRPAALMVLCQPFGPAARPTRVATRWVGLWGRLVTWLIFLGILFLLFSRR